MISIEPDYRHSDRVGADIVRLGAPTFVSYATAPATLVRIAEELDRTPDEIRSTVRVELESDTATIEVLAEDTDPERATEAANAVAEELERFRAADPDATLRAVPIAEAVTPSSPAGPPRLPHLSDHPLSVFQDPAVGTAIRAVRVTIEANLAAHSSVAVTSARSREGKTTVSALLATVLQRLDLRVLLVDGELRQAGLTQWCVSPVEHGLLGVLCGHRPSVSCRRAPMWMRAICSASASLGSSASTERSATSSSSTPHRC